MQLLDLMHTLHTKAAAVFSGWAQEAETTQAAEDSVSHGSVATVEEAGAGTSMLWVTCWCPLLQGEAFMSAFYRYSVSLALLTDISQVKIFLSGFLCYRLISWVEKWVLMVSSVICNISPQPHTDTGSLNTKEACVIPIGLYYSML